MRWPLAVPHVRDLEAGLVMTTPRTLISLLIAAGLALAVATSATAAKPAVTDIVRPLHSEGIEPFVSDVCGFDVELFNEGRIRIIEFADGTALSHHHETYTFAANGKSLMDNDNFTLFFGADDSLSLRGTNFNVQVPGAGNVLLEAGNVVFDRDGNIVKMAGIHDALEGTADLPAMCDYLAG